MKKTVLRMVLVLAFGFGISSCRFGSPDPFHRPWYNVYGQYCGTGYPAPGCNFFVTGRKITLTEDPFYRYGTNFFYSQWSFLDSFGYPRWFIGWAWQSPNGILYDQFGNALNETSGAEPSADVIAAAAEEEQKTRTAAGKAFAARFALNEEQGIRIARTLGDWALLGRDRSRTEADVEDFSKRLFGVRASRAEAALTRAFESRDRSAVEELNADVAAHWGTTPELSRKILLDWYREEASAILPAGK
jgi:hypothetical protein